MIVFGKNITILHSGLNEAEKTEQWLKTYEEKPSIIVGARSAIFAPVANLGLIVIDEEHEQVYKQDTTLKYNTRDVALVRAKEENAIVLFASATPSFETYKRAIDNKIDLLELPCRVSHRPMPSIAMIDMQLEKTKKGGTQILSDQLIHNIRDTLDQKSQVILLINRRGFAPRLKCENCGDLIQCPDCEQPLLYHYHIKTLSCSFCNYLIDYQERCSSCQSQMISYQGIAIEKIELLITKLFPQYNIARLDSDIIKTKHSHIEILNNFKNKKTDILIGTQMIAKGLDFPNVTLVGVIVGDASLNFPDFRAHEKSFQLLTQVAGRSGRGVLEGKVFIQSYNPTHSVFDYIEKNEFKNFYQEEMEGKKNTLFASIFT